VRPILQDGVQIQAHLEQMIEHLAFNCQSSRVDPWDALSSAPESRRRRTAVSEQSSDRAMTESQRCPQIFDRDPGLAEDALQRFQCNRSVVWNSYAKA
jgi:hypothetical protein